MNAPIAFDPIDALLDQLEPLRTEDVNWFVTRGVADADLRLSFPLHCAGDDVVVTIPNVEGEPIDFVRWNLSTGRRQAVTGEAWAVGQALVDVVPLNVPIPVHSGLLRWLRHGRTGLVILDQRVAAIRLCGRSTSTTPDFSERLHAILTPPAPHILVNYPPINWRGSARRRAAGKVTRSRHERANPHQRTQRVAP